MFGGDGVEDFEAVALVEEDAVRVVAVNAIEWCERAGFHDDAVEGISSFAKATADRDAVLCDEAFGRGGIIDRGQTGLASFGFARHKLIRSIGSVIRSRSI